MKKDVKALIKRLTLLAKIMETGKGWFSIDGSGYTWFSTERPCFFPSGHSESLDYWNILERGIFRGISTLDNMPLSMVCPNLPSSKALFYTDGVNVWLIDL